MDEKKHASTIFGNKCCFSGGKMCNNISVNMIVLLSCRNYWLYISQNMGQGIKMQNSQKQSQMAIIDGFSGGWCAPPKIFSPPQKVFPPQKFKCWFD
jgi:hypothetical protein